jgi:membrane-associated PAP2 superfamily phosphatase
MTILRYTMSLSLSASLITVCALVFAVTCPLQLTNGGDRDR